jgi:ornithine decarboxylase
MVQCSLFGLFLEEVRKIEFETQRHVCNTIRVTKPVMTTSKIEQLLNQQFSTSTFIFELDTIVEKYLALHQLYPDSQLYYAVKANSDLDILSRLVQLGSHFDTSSDREIQHCLAAGAQLDQISYDTANKEATDIAHAYELHVRLFSFDRLTDLEKLSIHAPNSRVCCRLILEDISERSMEHQSGTEQAYQLLIHSQKLGLIPHGLTFQIACDPFSRTYRFGW